jgi:hypothetical protein
LWVTISKNSKFITAEEEKILLEVSRFGNEKDFAGQNFLVAEVGKKSGRNYLV